MGLFGALFDFSFSRFVTTSFVKFIYGIGIAFVGILTLGFVAGGFLDSAGRGLVFLLLSPIFFLFFVIVLRIYLEIVIVVFRIAEYLREMSPPPGGSR